MTVKAIRRIPQTSGERLTQGYCGTREYVLQFRSAASTSVRTSPLLNEPPLLLSDELKQGQLWGWAKRPHGLQPDWICS